MTTTFFSALSTLFNGSRRSSVAYQNTLMTYAKIEYKNDWEYAYQHMLEHDGAGPRMASVPKPIQRKHEIKVTIK